MDTDEQPGEPPEPGGRSAVGAITVEVSDGTGGLPAGVTGWLRDRASEAGLHLGGIGEVRVRVVDDAEMGAAHERWSGVPGPTDVLTFDLRDPPGHRELDVDILVCADVARRRVSDGGDDVLARELLLYVVHGMLHCMGHDDRDEDSSRAMHEEEDRVLEAIGVGRVYRVSPSDDGTRDGGTV